MDDRALAMIFDAQCGMATTAQIVACGLSRSGIRHRVATARLFSPFRAVYTPSPYMDEQAWRWAAVLAAGPETAMLSHGSAAHFHGLARVRPATPHVTVPGSGRLGVAGVAVHRSRTLRPDDIVVVEGLRVTSPPRTVLDMAVEGSDDEVFRLIREGEYRRLLPTGAMSVAIAGRPTHPGAGRVRRVDPFTVESALEQTPLEDELEALIETLPLPAPARQFRVRGSSRTPYRIDFVWEALRLAVEADGRAAHERVAAFAADRSRDADLSAVGWLTMRFTRAQVLTDPKRVGRDLIGAAIHRGWKPGG
jgi:very-short-patch-repair endonuclease